MGKIKQENIDKDSVLVDDTEKNVRRDIEEKIFYGATGGRRMNKGNLSSYRGVERFKEKHRVYMVNGCAVPSDMFIGRVSASIYNHTSDNNFREILDILCEDLDGSQMLTIGGNQFFSYRTDQEVKHVGPFLFGHEPKDIPKKTYEVSFDIEIVSYVISKRRWKRTSEKVEASSYSEAKHIIRNKYRKDQTTFFNGKPRTIKNLEAVLIEVDTDDKE